MDFQKCYEWLSVLSNDDLTLIFAAIFPKLKRTFNMARTSMDVINHGLAPYFKSSLKTSIDRPDIFSFSVDESLHESFKLQKWTYM